MSITKKGVKRQYITEPGLVLWLPFDGDVRDYSGNSNHGTNVGATFVGGKRGSALSLDGNDYIEMADASSLRLAQWTLGIWSNGASQIGILFSKGVGGNTNYYIQTVTIGRIESGFYSGDWRSVITGYSAYTVGTWSHIVTTFDGIFIRIFVNGVLKATSVDLSAYSPVTGTTVLRIGVESVTYFTGLLDEVRIYNRALNANEIWDLYQRGL